jgi:hypothetical protein
MRCLGECLLPEHAQALKVRIGYMNVASKSSFQVVLSIYGVGCKVFEVGVRWLAY